LIMQPHIGRRVQWKVLGGWEGEGKGESKGNYVERINEEKWKSREGLRRWVERIK